MTNCPNCGAPITGDKCEYCGTVFRMPDFQEIREKRFQIEMLEAQMRMNDFIIKSLSCKSQKQN